MRVRRGWALVVVVVGVGSLLTALASLAADRPVVAIPLGVVGGVLATVGGMLSVTGSRHDLARGEGSGRAGRHVAFGLIPRQAAWFQPRPAEHGELVKALGRKGKAALVALPGARGAGKTQLAAEYARECVKQGYDLVAWINAEASPDTEMALLGEQLGLRTSPGQSPAQLAACTVEYIEAMSGKALLVFDNAVDPDSIKDLLPGGSAKVLITTNQQEVTLIPGVTGVGVGMFTAAQGHAFLTAATGLPASDDIQVVGEQLDWLPLGLAQAAAYIRLNQISYAEYARRLSRVDIDEALQRFAGTQHQGVLAAIRLSLQALGRADPSGDTVKLLTVLSLLAPEGISRTTLSSPETIAELGFSESGLDHALSVLANTSLVTLAKPAAANIDQLPGEHDQVVVVVHRLTARIVRHDGAQAAGDTYSQAVAQAAEALRALTAGIPQHQAALRRADTEQLAAHILALHSHARAQSVDLDHIGDWAGKALAVLGDFSRAIAIHQAVLDESIRALGPDHPDTLASGSELATSYHRAGRTGEAIAMFERNLADYERILGPDHPDTLTSRNNLATNYRAARRTGEAITLHERNLADRERILGPDHPDTLTSRNNLAISYHRAGRTSEAIALFERNLADSERILGPDHPNTLITRNNLASSYQEAGRTGEAIELKERNLADRERILGPDHPDTLTSRNNLAISYRAARRTGEAIAMHERNLADCERILGPDHPDTLKSRNNLANSYRAAGRTSEADQIMQNR